MEALDEQGFGEDAQITDGMRIVAVDHEAGAATSIHSSSGPAHTRKVRLADARPIRVVEAMSFRDD